MRLTERRRAAAALALALLWAAPALASVLTYHNSNRRHGLYVVPGLTFAAAGTMHRDTRFAPALTGQIFAQPLYWRPREAGPGHVVVATEANIVYALDEATGAIEWQTALPPPVPHKKLPCGNIDPLGITGTPVIDPATARVYFDAQTLTADGPRHKIYALSLSDGAIVSGWPLDVQTAAAAKGTVLLHLVDAAGASRAGVAATSFTITGGNGPHFLDANMMAVTAATSSSKSGWVVFFDVPPGIAGLTQPGSAAVTIEMPAVPVAAGVVSIARARVGDGAPALPSNVSFSTQIVPIFAARGCVACHSGSGTGKDLGDLTLSGSANLIYKELVTEKPNTRVRLAAPETSLILTMPSREDPPDGHPNVTFTGPRDPDYLKLLVWIREGAKNN